MAFVILKDGTRQVLPPSTASRLWLCINGYSKPKNLAQTLYIERVYKLYLGPRTKHLLHKEYERRQQTLFDRQATAN